jgi:hypothetical protein
MLCSPLRRSSDGVNIPYLMVEKPNRKSSNYAVARLAAA